MGGLDGKNRLKKSPEKSCDYLDFPGPVIFLNKPMLLPSELVCNLAELIFKEKVITLTRLLHKYILFTSWAFI